MNDFGEIMPFDVGGMDMRFGIAEDGRTFVIASDYTRALGYGQASDATRLLDPHEAGQQIVLTRSANGVEQRRELNVIYEDGIWELIFRSSLPGAKAIKAQVKSILRQIRETGRYAPVAEEVPSHAVALRRWAEQIEAREAAEAAAELAQRQVKELAPAANAWSALAEAKGDYSLRDAAHILNRDPNIKTGQNRLMVKLQELGMVDRKGVPYAKNDRHLRELPRAYEHPHTGEPVLGKPQIRITVTGLKYLHERMGGIAPLRFDTWPETG